MTQRIPEGAFEDYVGLGSKRSYQAVAERYGVSKRTVVRHAAKQRWADRLDAIQREARVEVDKRLATELAEMNERHLKMLRAIASRAVTAIKDHPLSTGMEGVRAAELAIKMERLLAGESSENTSVSVEEVTRQEIARWIVPANEVDDDPEDLQ